MELRPYQIEGIDNVREAMRQHRRVVYVAPTGTGKTVIAAEITRRSVERFRHVLFLAPRRELITQCSEKLERFGVEHGVILAGEDRKRSLFTQVQVASFDTLYARAVRRERILLPPADLLIVDEAHLSVARTRKHIIEQYPNAYVIGITATPTRRDGRGLDEIYETIVDTWPLSRFIEEGYLAPFRFFAPSQPDLEAVSINRATKDYHEGELASAMDKPMLIGDIVDQWERLAAGRKSIVFCCSIAHAVHVAEAFRGQSIAAEHVSAFTSTEQRQAIIARLHSGETRVVTNCFLLSYGFDCPSVECIVLARPTKSVAMYLQMRGRGQRPSPQTGKVDCLVIDHGGVIAEHGTLMDEIPWTLAAEGTIRERIDAQRKKREEPKDITCIKCGTVFRQHRRCPNCGHECVPKGEAMPIWEADLVEVAPRAEHLRHDIHAMAEFYAQLRGFEEERGYKPGWAYFQFRKKYGHEPSSDFRLLTPRVPSPEVRRWCMSRLIAYARATQREGIRA